MLERLTTEANNPQSAEIDRLTSLEIVRLMNAEDQKVAEAVGREADSISRAIDAIVERFQRGGRLVYAGAGTSGRLGVLDAAECPPTFSTPPEMVVGLIAGGPPALTRAVEGAEDNPELAVADLVQINLAANDTLVAIATSGRTPYAMGALRHARSVGAYAIGFTCNADSDLASIADLVIAPIVGPEILSGSTRLKAGTATKLTLNMLTTGAMIGIGKTYGNRMVDLRPTNTKLRARALRLVSQIADVTPEQASALLERASNEVKTAIVCHRRQVEPERARILLSEALGQLRKVIG